MHNSYCYDLPYLMGRLDEGYAIVTKSKNSQLHFNQSYHDRYLEISPETRRKKVIMQHIRYLIHRAERI